MTAAAADREDWLRRYHPAQPGAVQLLCLPHAGGSATYFFPLAKALSPDVDVICVQYPGRQDRRTERPVDNLDTLADRLFEALAPQPGHPLVIFGHSMGAVLGFELARRIERTVPGAPLGLIASGRRAPVVHRYEDVHLRDDAGMITEIQKLSGTDPGVLTDEEMLRMILPALRADYRAVETYRYRPGERLRAPISVLIGDSDPRVSLADARAWEQLTDGDFTFRVFPGGHFYLNGQQAAVSAAISASIDGFQQRIRAV